jgi:hypothetical protein
VLDRHSDTTLSVGASDSSTTCDAEREATLGAVRSVGPAKGVKAGSTSRTGAVIVARGAGARGLGGAAKLKVRNLQWPNQVERELLHEDTCGLRDFL